MIPKYVQVGPFEYTVELRHGHTDTSGDLATTLLAHSTITLDANIGLQHLRKSLLHEVMHACWFDSTGGNGADDAYTEEQIMKLLTTPLLDTLRRNPELVHFLLDA